MPSPRIRLTMASARSSSTPSRNACWSSRSTAVPPSSERWCRIESSLRLLGLGEEHGQRRDGRIPFDQARLRAVGGERLLEDRPDRGLDRAGMVVEVELPAVDLDHGVAGEMELADARL